ncbi:hypothetical protein GCM10025873_21310 [Demequina sediminis]|nr:hypothetical protein GCM10025873_21310 [Demequina sediminis]
MGPDMSGRESLGVWIYGTRAATIAESTNDRLSLAWTSEAAERWPLGSRILSAKLPIGEPVGSPMVKNYLDGLLPEGNARTNHAFDAGIPPDDTFGLIRAYGLDTPGAAVFAPDSARDPERTGHYEPIDLAELEARIVHADTRSPAAGTADSSTLPGMVPKIVAHRAEDGTWLACKEGAASTWIIKRGNPADSLTADTIDTEVAALHLARTLGLTDIRAEILEFESTRAIAVSRYDRTIDDSGVVERWHQEDLAQAIGLDTRDPNRKFQWGSTMPSLRHAAAVMRADGADLRALLRLVTFSTLVGNTDMHAKNISFLRYDDGTAELSPAYDIAMHLHHERDGRRFALDVNSKTLVDDITVSDVIAEAEAWGIPGRLARNTVSAVIGDLSTVLTEIDRSAYRGVSDQAWEIVWERTEAAASQMGTTASSRSVARRGPRRPR